MLASEKREKNRKDSPWNPEALNLNCGLSWGSQEHPKPTGIPCREAHEDLTLHTYSKALWSSEGSQFLGEAAADRTGTLCEPCKLRDLATLCRPPPPWPLRSRQCQEQSRGSAGCLEPETGHASTSLSVLPGTEPLEASRPGLGAQIRDGKV